MTLNSRTGSITAADFFDLFNQEQRADDQATYRIACPVRNAHASEITTESSGERGHQLKLNNDIPKHCGNTAALSDDQDFLEGQILEESIEKLVTMSHLDANSQHATQPQFETNSAATINGNNTTKTTQSEMIEKDADLKDFLDFSNWNDLEQRAKILRKGRRNRALLIIEAQRAALLAEAAEDDDQVQTNPPSAGERTPKTIVAPSKVTAELSPAEAKRKFGDLTAMDNHDGDARNVKLKKEVNQESRKLSEVAKTYNGNAARSEHDRDLVAAPKQPRMHDNEQRTHERPSNLDEGRDLRALQAQDEALVENGRDSAHGREQNGRNDAQRTSRKLVDKGLSWDNASAAIGDRIRRAEPFRDTRGFILGRRGEARYFMIKSFNEENVVRSFEEGVWMTQAHNKDILVDAFNTTRNVVLFFSINKSKAFQGVARMDSLPGTVPVPKWRDSITFDTTGAFRVRWLTLCHTPYRKVAHIINYYNEEQRPVFVGKDGQEIDCDAGFSLIKVIQDEAAYLSY